jgi:hypothetical protein
MKVFDIEFNENDIFYYIGFFFVIIFAIYIIMILANTQMKVVEGLVGSSNTQQTTQSFTDLMAKGDIENLKISMQKMNDTILLSKYRSDYEDIIIKLEELIDQNLLYTTLQVVANVDKTTGLIKIKDQSSKDQEGISITDLQLINELYKYKQNLNETMSFIDGK